MKRRATQLLILAFVSAIAGFLLAQIRTALLTGMEEKRSARPTRAAPAGWRASRLAPGHAVHVINEGKLNFRMLYLLPFIKVKYIVKPDCIFT